MCEWGMLYSKSDLEKAHSPKNFLRQVRMSSQSKKMTEQFHFFLKNFQMKSEADNSNSSMETFSSSPSPGKITRSSQTFRTTSAENFYKSFLKQKISQK